MKPNPTCSGCGAPTDYRGGYLPPPTDHELEVARISLGFQPSGGVPEQMFMCRDIGKHGSLSFCPTCGVRTEALKLSDSLLAAAPDLLKALVEIANHLSPGRCRDMAKAAIAKAKGK